MNGCDNRLAFFKGFVAILNDVDEPDADWENRLGCAWDALGEFAEQLGQDFVKIANWEGRLDYRDRREG